MTHSTTFNQAIKTTATVSAHPEHLSVVVTARVTPSQHIVLVDNATLLNMPLSHYVRSLIVDEKAQRKLVRLAGTKQRQMDTAKVLSALSQTRIANNLNALAKGLHTGNLIFSPDVVAQINEAYSMVRDIRRELILRQGLHA
jgi:hypothetical protein